MRSTLMTDPAKITPSKACWFGLYGEIPAKIIESGGGGLTLWLFPEGGKMRGAPRGGDLKSLRPRPDEKILARLKRSLRGAL